MEQKNEEHYHPSSPVMSKLGFHKTWVESTIIGSPDRMELKKKTSWVEWPPKPVVTCDPGVVGQPKFLTFL